MKGGVKAGSRLLVVHVNRNEALDASGPRFGLIVSKAVGNAVIRHRTSRRLRHVCMTFFDQLDPNIDVCVRALPSSGQASSEQLHKDMSKALSKALAKLEQK